jgi:hypothetical protein
MEPVEAEVGLAMSGVKITLNVTAGEEADTCVLSDGARSATVIFPHGSDEVIVEVAEVAGAVLPPSGPGPAPGTVAAGGTAAE